MCGSEKIKDYNELKNLGNNLQKKNLKQETDSHNKKSGTGKSL